MKRIITCVTLIVLAVIVCCFAGPSIVCSQETNMAKVDRLLNQTGYIIVKKTPNVWYIDFTGKNLPSYKVIISTDQDEVTDVVVFVMVIKKKDFIQSVESLYKLLKFNHKLDRIKVGLDDDDDISVRVDCDSRITDAQELKAIIGQVASSSEEVCAGMKPFFTTAR